MAFQMCDGRQNIFPLAHWYHGFNVSKADENWFLGEPDFNVLTNSLWRNHIPLLFQKKPETWRYGWLRKISEHWRDTPRHAATADIFSSDNSPLIWAFLSFAGFPGTNWCCVKVWVAKESPLTLLGPRLWRQPRKGIYCWTLVAGPWSKTETGGPFGPSPVGAPSTSGTQTSKCTKSEPKNSLWISLFFQPTEMRGLLWAGQEEAYLVLSCMNGLISHLRHTLADCGNPIIRTTFQTHDQDFYYVDQMLAVTDLMLLCKTKEATKSN